ncbi:MAG: hypothetical protein ACPGWR_04265 [Ardenticatenaceae bacterium]
MRKPFRESDIFEMMHKHIGVRYIYDQACPEPAVLRQAQEPWDQTGSEGTTVALEEALTPAALAALPEALLAQLEEAAEGSDMEMMEQVLAQISQLDPALASQLTKLADEFEYDEILQLIEEANVSKKRKGQPRGIAPTNSKCFSEGL